MNEIRLQRRRVRQATGELLAAGDLRQRVREAPLPWLLGAGVVGLVAGRFFARPIAAAGRRRLSSAIGGRVREAVVSGMLAALGLSSRSGSDGAPAHEPVPAAGPGAPATDSRTASRDPRAPDLSPRGETS